MKGVKVNPIIVIDRFGPSTLRPVVTTTTPVNPNICLIQTLSEALIALKRNLKIR